MSSLAVPLGIFLTIAAGCCSAFNLSMLVTLWNGSFLSPKHGGTFLLAFAHIFGSFITTFLVAFYLGPAIIAQKFLFESLFYPELIGVIFHAQWFEDMLLQLITGINRWLIIVYPRTAIFFTQRTNIIIIIFAYIFGAFLSILTTYILPCCPIFLYYKTFTFSYLRNDYNASDYFVDLPINISCSFIAAICYFRIYLYVRNTNSQMSNIVSKSEAATRKNKEAKYAVQFAACTGFCIVAWICFRVIPLLIPDHLMELYMIITLLTLCHCISNSFVFFTFNPEIRRRYIFSTAKLPKESTVAHSMVPSTAQNITTPATFVNVTA